MLRTVGRLDSRSCGKLQFTMRRAAHTSMVIYLSLESVLSRSSSAVKLEIRIVHNDAVIIPPLPSNLKPAMIIA